MLHVVSVLRRSLAIQHRLNFSSEKRDSKFSPSSPACSSTPLLPQSCGGRGGSVTFCPPRAAVTALLFYSVSHLSVFDGSLSLKASTQALCSTSGSHIFSRTPFSLFFLPTASINSSFSQTLSICLLFCDTFVRIR